MYTGQIFIAGTPVTVSAAVSAGYIIVDGNGDIWLKSDSNRQIKITGDLKLG